MKTTVVRYKVKRDRAEENVAHIKKVFEQLQRESPGGLRYCSFQLDDGVSFLHIAASTAFLSRSHAGQRDR